MTMAQAPMNESSTPLVNAPTIETAGDLTVFVEDLLLQMQNRFHDLGTKINGRMDALGKRIDELEQHICELAEEAGLDKDVILGSASRHNQLGSITSTTTNNVTTSSLPRSPVQRVSKPKVTSTQIEI